MAGPPFFRLVPYPQWGGPNLEIVVQNANVKKMKFQVCMFKGQICLKLMIQMFFCFVCAGCVMLLASAGSWFWFWYWLILDWAAPVCYIPSCEMDQSQQTEVCTEWINHEI